VVDGFSTKWLDTGEAEVARLRHRRGGGCRASTTAFLVPVAVQVVLVVDDGLLQVGAREREMRDESNSKKEEKRAHGGGRHREQGERRHLRVIPASFGVGVGSGTDQQ
jgi:hypothetical protein